MDIKDFIEKKAHCIKIKVTSANDSLIPVYATEGAAGADLQANIDADVVIAPGSSKLIPTGLKFEIPVGFEIQIRPRSGLALKHQVTVLNTPGTIDSDYRGEVGVILINHGKTDFVVTPKMRIAQMVVAQVMVAQFEQACELATSQRAAGGFGHTGL